MKKVARTRGGARAVEALAGGLLGAGAGAAGQSLMYEPKRPRDWMDREGNVFRRPLSRKEKKQKVDLLLQAAALAALGGGALSVGGGALARATVAKVERELAPRVIDEHLEGLRNIVRQRHDLWRRREGGRLVTRASRKASELDYYNARNLLGTEEKKLQGLLVKAKKERAKLPWGGPSRRSEGGRRIDPGSRYSPDRFTTHQGQISEHYRDLRKAYHLPPLQGPDDRHTGEKFYESMLDRLSGREKSAFSFREEALAIQNALEG